ncbi:MAG: methionyl-tRNA formyltransferase [Candidatus Edwardsbacteria bacterium]
MQIIFMGTPEFAVPSLKRLTEDGHEISAVVTQPDRPKGRGRGIELSAVKKFAMNKNFSLLQPEKSRDESFVESLRSLSPELIIVVAYGHILPKEILEIPTKGCVNLHASLLPKFRGAAPINWAIIRGEKETGVTTIFMNEKMDAGEIILQEKTPILEEETAGELENRLSFLGANLLSETLHLIEKGKVSPISQNDIEATFAPKIKKENGLIDWQKPAGELVNFIRGLNPEPSAYTFFRGKFIKILKSMAIEQKGEKKQPGEIVGLTKERMEVQGQDGFLLPLLLQPESRRIINITEFISGYHPKVGEILGDER